MLILAQSFQKDKFDGLNPLQTGNTSGKRLKGWFPFESRDFGRGRGDASAPSESGTAQAHDPLFDKPVMEHIISLLRRSGITEIAVTLHYMPRAVTDHFGDGAAQGVHLRYFTETEPLGTAGGVKNCMPFLGDEDFLVISGDAVCDLDLKQAMDFHATRRPAATLVLHRHPTPLEYGLVLTDPEGRVERFVEKPAWGQVVTNQVNTGIYLLTRRAMDLVPEGKPFDLPGTCFQQLMGARRGPVRAV